MYIPNYKNIHSHPPQPPYSNFSLLSVLSREKITRPNYLDWIRTLRISLIYENKVYVLDDDIPEVTNDDTNDQIVA